MIVSFTFIHIDRVIKQLIISWTFIQQTLCRHLELSIISFHKRGDVFSKNFNHFRSLSVLNCFAKCGPALLHWIDLREWIERFDSRRFFVIIIIQTATSFDRDRFVRSSISSNSLHDRFCGKLGRFSQWKRRRYWEGHQRLARWGVKVFFAFIQRLLQDCPFTKSSFVRKSSALPGINLRLYCGIQIFISRATVLLSMMTP